VVNQEEADRDIPKLLAIPAHTRFLSCEPLLGPITFEGRWVDHPNPAMHENWLEALDWVIVGGESGSRARPMAFNWALSLMQQCEATETAFFMKQGSQNGWPDFKNINSFSAQLQVRRWPEARP
jgi:protein gp37